MKVAIVHDWLVSYRGGEKVLEAILELYPNAPIYTLFFEKNELSPYLQKRQVRYSKLLNFFRPIRKPLLPFLPTAIERLDLEGFDLIISTSSCVAKGLITPPHAQHICYLHSPMRYIWDQKRHYFGKLLDVFLLGPCIEFVLSTLRVWDMASATRCDHFIVNSNFVGQRVKKFYGRKSTVIHPPIDFDFFAKENLGKKSDYFVVAGAFVPYKRFDLAIQACQERGQKLIIVGQGPLLSSLQKMITSTTEIIVAPNDEKLRSILAGAKALIFPGVEDFGLLAIEAMASGTPVIAFKQGGALDFIQEGKNGLFFAEATKESLKDALARFASQSFDFAYIREYARTFGKERFKREFTTEVCRHLGVSRSE